MYAVTRPSHVPEIPDLQDFPNRYQYFARQRFEHFALSAPYISRAER
eukprot:GSA25T00011888001.1